MTNLIHRLEQAEPGQERELDAEIALAFGWERCTDEEGIEYWLPPEGSKTPSHVRRPYRFGDYSEHREALPRFTVSVDAAMMLVPEGYGYGVADPKGGVAPSGLIFDRQGLHVECRASTAALALCCAALKAREAGRG